MLLFEKRSRRNSHFCWSKLISWLSVFPYWQFIYLFILLGGGECINIRLRTGNPRFMQWMLRAKTSQEINVGEGLRHLWHLFPLAASQWKMPVAMRTKMYGLSESSSGMTARMRMVGRRRVTKQPVKVLLQLWNSTYSTEGDNVYLIVCVSISYMYRIFFLSTQSLPISFMIELNFPFLQRWWTLNQRWLSVKGRRTQGVHSIILQWLVLFDSESPFILEDTLRTTSCRWTSAMYYFNILFRHTANRHIWIHTK